VVDGAFAPRAVALAVKKNHSWRKPVPAQQGNAPTLEGSAQTRVLDGADWVNRRAMIWSCRNKPRCAGREEVQLVPDPGHSWAKQRASHFTRGGTFMTILTQLRAIRLLALGMLLILPAASGAQQRPPILEKLTKTYGLQSFGQIDAIRYTFNVEAPGLSFSRSWTWEPKTDQVTYEGKDKSGNSVKVTYQRSQLGSQPTNVRDDIDPGFLNDNYWLLLPFHLSWDTNAAVEDAGVQKLPQGNGSAEKVVAKYSSDGGYSPGDTWELYVGSNGRIEEMAYHRGGPPKLEVFATWTDYNKAGPMLFSLDHRGTRNGGPLHLFFSNVAVKLVGSNTWIDAR
jgi:hypothetical protein